MLEAAIAQTGLASRHSRLITGRSNVNISSGIGKSEVVKKDDYR